MAKRGRARAKEETRDKLLAAGIALFGEQGLDAPSLDAVCERAGFTRGAFYVHFRDRDDFLVAVMERVGGPLLDAIFDPGEELDLGRTVLRFLSAARDGTYPLTPAGGIRPHQLLDACARSPRIRALYVGLVTDSITRLSAILEHEREAGRLRADVTPERLATVLLAAVIGAQTMMELGAPVDLVGCAVELVATLRPGPAT